MEQSANPAARVGHYTRTISTSTQNAAVWSLTAAAPSDSVFYGLCTNLLTYLLTYLLNTFSLDYNAALYDFVFYLFVFVFLIVRLCTVYICVSLCTSDSLSGPRVLLSLILNK